jgi:peptidoglycan glycosyltransferase
MMPQCHGFVRWIATLLIGLALPLLWSISGASEASSPLQVVSDLAMGGHRGSLVVINVGQGNLLAAVHADIAAHAVITPGSTLKPFVLMALLESGKVRKGEQIVCGRVLKIGNVGMNCSHPAAVKLLDAEDAIAYSCNSYVAAVAPRLTADELAQTLHAQGFDSPSGLFAGEAVGHIVRTKDTDDLKLQALGTRDVAVTPLELLEAYRKLAVKYDASRNSVADAPVFNGLEDSVTFGMAHAAHVNGMKVAGKTGTAASPNDARTHGIFVGYAPANSPEIVMVVYLEDGRGLDAAAAARPVLEEFAQEKATR